ncbi:acyl-CoA dehydrogenase family protein [Streptomyces sp. NPDC001985]|uniref:acyl-CoA dehydrogenase family protein n=1 Tax=Streptomyces sp. NPDC001985 TaxID=3154406 RepID=UPI003324A8A4
MAGALPLPTALESAIAARFAEDGAEAPLAPARSARLDEREEFPDLECALLDALRVPRAYVPPELGGAGGGLPELVETLRTVARHDLTSAVAHGKTFLGAAPVWLSGGPAQAGGLARAVLAGAVVCWGLTEPGRGSDLLAGELTATATDRGTWLLDGVKWPVNNATRSRFCTVLARTDPRGGPRGFTLFLVDKDTLGPGHHRHLPKEPTHGIRGADISGIALHRAEVGADTVVGAAGEGAETVLRALQLTRTVCCSLSVGAGEHALRLALDFARNRALYGTSLLRLPHARNTLATAAATLCLAEAATTVAARCAHALPGEQSVVSALAKAAVPELAQSVIDDCAEVLGARGFLTGLHAHGMFQKLERDHRIVSIFDGSTAVNRNALINQFPVLVRAQRTGRHDAAGLAAATDPRAELPGLDPARLRLMSRTGCSVVQGLAAATTRLDGRRTAPERTVALARRLRTLTDDTTERMAAVRPSARELPAGAFALARAYETCFAGAAALHLWLAADPGTEGSLRLEAALARAVDLLTPGGEPAPAGLYEDLLATLGATGAEEETGTP